MYRMMKKTFSELLFYKFWSSFIMSFPVSFINTRKTAFYGFSVQIHERMLVVKDGENTIGHMKRQIK